MAEHPMTQAEATAQLADQIGELAVVLRSIQRRGRWTTALGALAVAALLVVSTVGTMAMLDRNSRTEQTTQIVEAIRGCTTPGNACYDANQERSNARLAPLIIKLCAAIPEADPEKHRPPCT